MGHVNGRAQHLCARNARHIGDRGLEPPSNATARRPSAPAGTNFVADSQNANRLLLLSQRHMRQLASSGKDHAEASSEAFIDVHVGSNYANIHKLRHSSVNLPTIVKQLECICSIPFYGLHILACILACCQGRTSFWVHGSIRRRGRCGPSP